MYYFTLHAPCFKVQESTEMSRTAQRKYATVYISDITTIKVSLLSNNRMIELDYFMLTPIATLSQILSP